MDIRLQAYADNQDVAGLMKAAFGGERAATERLAFAPRSAS